MHHPTTQLLVILKSAPKEISGDALLIGCILLGFIIALVTLSNTANSLTRTTTFIFLELVIILVLLWYFTPTGIAIGFGWLTTVIVVFVFRITEPSKKKPTKELKE